MRNNNLRGLLIAAIIVITASISLAAIDGNWVKAIPADMTNGNTYDVSVDSNGIPSGWYTGPDWVGEDGWNPPTDKWYLWASNGGIDPDGSGGWNDADHYCIYNTDFNPPAIRTDIDGLVPGLSYTVRVIYGVTSDPNVGGVWCGLGSDPNDWAWYNSSNGTSTGIWVPGRSSGADGQPWPSQQAVLGDVVANNDGIISVWIGYGQTTFYDGLSYERAYPEDQMLGTWIKAIPADMPNGNTYNDETGDPNGWYTGPDWTGEDGWNPPTDKWYLWASNGGIGPDGSGGWNDADYYCIYNDNFNPPVIRTDITGLVSGNEYKIRVIYGVTSIAGTGGVWCGLGPNVGDWNWYNSLNGSSTGLWVPGRSGGTGEEPWPVQQAVLGDAVAVDGKISVWIGYGQGTFYDGLTYEPLNPCELMISEGWGLISDFNNDCYVNIADLGELALDWLRCMNPDDINCEHPWE